LYFITIFYWDLCPTGNSSKELTVNSEQFSVSSLPRFTGKWEKTLRGVDSVFDRVAIGSDGLKQPKEKE